MSSRSCATCSLFSALDTATWRRRVCSRVAFVARIACQELTTAPTTNTAAMAVAAAETPLFLWTGFFRREKGLGGGPDAGVARQGRAQSLCLALHVSYSLAPAFFLHFLPIPFTPAPHP